MKLALYVHDFKIEIGHSNSLIELIRHLPQDFQKEIEEIEVVSYSTGDLSEYFDGFSGQMRWVKVPFPNLKPVLFKSLFFQLWTYLYNQFFQPKGFYRIGIGISCLDVDAVSIQFIHHQWTSKGLQLEKANWARFFYKKLLFWYFECCETILFCRPHLKVFTPAKFLTEYIREINSKLNTTTIYSGVNLSRFEVTNLDQESLYTDLSKKYPALKDLNPSLPIYLFVGAFERKGLKDALHLLSKDKSNSQLIVVGSGASGLEIEWPRDVKVFPVGFTREVSKFYALADAFIFPTIYEPFGLVLFEAMAMGLTIITRRQDVGASELLDGLEEVYFCDVDHFKMPTVTKKDFMAKRLLRDSRLKQLGDVSWTKAGLELAQFLQRMP